MGVRTALSARKRGEAQARRAEKKKRPAMSTEEAASIRRLAREGDVAGLVSYAWWARIGHRMLPRVVESLSSSQASGDAERMMETAHRAARVIKRREIVIGALLIPVYAGVLYFKRDQLVQTIVVLAVLFLGSYAMYGRRWRSRGKS